MLFELSLQKQPSLITELNLELAVNHNKIQYEANYNNEAK